MTRSILLLSLMCVSALTACQRTDPAPAPVVIQQVPGPAGPAGATGVPGATGMPGMDGSKGDAGKAGEGTLVIVAPPAAAPASAASN